MITKKKEAVEQITIWFELIKPFLNKTCSVQFDMHKSTGFIMTGLELQAYNGISHKLSPRDNNGKQQRPKLFTLMNNQASFIFSLDDTQISSLGNGIRISIPLEKPLNNKNVMEIDIRLES